MFGRHSIRTRGRRDRGLAAFAILLAGCASADKNLDRALDDAAPASSSSSSSMPGMNMGRARDQRRQRVGRRDQGGADPGARVATWQGMKITAEATTAVPFVIYNGTSEQMVKPAAEDELSPDGDAQRRPDRSRDPVRERLGDDQQERARSSTTSASGR